MPDNEGKRAYSPFKEIQQSYETCLIISRVGEKRKKVQNTDADIYVSCDLLVWEVCKLLQSEETEMKGGTGWEAIFKR